MGWSNITYLAARAQVNTFGKRVIFIFDDGTKSEGKAIITTKEDDLKNEYAKIDSSSLIASVFKAMTPEPYKLKKMIVQNETYRITTRKISDDGFNCFSLALEQEDFGPQVFDIEEGDFDAS